LTFDVHCQNGWMWIKCHFRRQLWTRCLELRNPRLATAKLLNTTVQQIVTVLRVRITEGLWVHLT